tara:strand:+ start:91 stop:1146 length:1056 start_codon:yes stop_codon:yes gene_type:complete
LTLDSIYIVVLIVITLTLAILTYYQFKKPSNKKRTDTIYMEALNAMLLSDKRKAINLLSTLVKNDSEHVSAYLQLGNLLRYEDTDRAIKIHQMLTVRQKLDKETKIEILKSLALDYKKINQLSKSKVEAEKIFEFDKTNLWANEFLLSLAEETEDWDYAEKRARDLKKIKSFDGKVNLSKYTLQKGIRHLEKNNFKESENLLKKAINESPEFAMPYKYLGDIKYSNRDLVKAVEFWEKFMDLSPSESHLVFDNIETALFDLGRYSEVEKFYKKVLENNSKDLNAGLRLANVLNEKGENKAAINLIDSFINEENPSILVMLMKLKLSLSTKTPAELAHYLDKIINILKSSNE